MTLFLRFTFFWTVRVGECLKEGKGDEEGKPTRRDQKEKETETRKKKP